MPYESERNDADPNPKRTIVPEGPEPYASSSRTPSNHSGDADVAHALTPRGRLARFEKKFFGRYVPSRDYVDVLCSRYWRYKDASFVFYRGAVLSLNHIWSRWCTANGIYRNQSYEWKVQRVDFRKVVDGLAVVWDTWDDLKYEIEKCGYRSPEDCDSFITRVHDVRLLKALDRLSTAEWALDVEVVTPSIWKNSIRCKDKHRGKFDPFRDLQRREQMRDLYEHHLPEVFGDKKLQPTLFHCLYYDLVRANEFGSRLPCRQSGDPIDGQQHERRLTGQGLYPLASQSPEEDGSLTSLAMSQRRASVSWSLRNIPYLQDEPSPRDNTRNRRTSSDSDMMTFMLLW